MSGPIIQKSTCVRLEAPFTDKDLAQFLSALEQNFPKGATVTAKVEYNQDTSGTVTLMATETNESKYEPKPEPKPEAG